MRSRFTLLLGFLAAFAISSPVVAAPEAEEAKAEEAKPEEAKAEEAKAEEAKAEEAKAEEAKAEEAKAEEPKAEEAKAEEAKAEEPKEIETDEEAVEAAKDLITAIHEKHWALVIGLGLSLLVFILRKVKVLAKVPKKALPWVTAALGIMTYVAAALMAEDANLSDALLGGAMAGAAAVGLWEMLLKNFLGGSAASSEKEPKEEEEKPKEEEGEEPKEEGDG